MLDQAFRTSQTESQAPQATAADKPHRKNKKGPQSQQSTAGVLFALVKEEQGKGDIPILTECFPVESDAMLAAFKKGTDYYKLQRCRVGVTVKEGTVTFTSSAAEHQNPHK